MPHRNRERRELVLLFDGGDITSDGRAPVFKKLEERTSIVRRFAACFEDYRKSDRIGRPLLDPIGQRVFAPSASTRPVYPGLGVNLGIQLNVEA